MKFIKTISNLFFGNIILGNCFYYYNNNKSFLPKDIIGKGALYIPTLIHSKIVFDRGFNYEKIGKEDLAVECWTKAWFFRNSFLGKDHPDTILSKEVLIKKAPNFLEYHNKMVDKGIIPDDQPKEFSSNKDVPAIEDGSLLYRTDEDYLDEYNNPDYEGGDGIELKEVTSMLSAMGFLSESWGNYDKALDYWWKAYLIRIREVGHNNPDTIESRKVLIEKDPDFFITYKHLADNDLIPGEKQTELSTNKFVTARENGSPLQETDQDLPNEDSETDFTGLLNEFLYQEM